MINIGYHCTACNTDLAGAKQLKEHITNCEIHKIYEKEVRKFNSIKVNNILKDNWMFLDLGMSSTAQGLISSKKTMKEYAEELGWDVKSDKEGYTAQNGLRFYSVSCFPHNNEPISPINLQKDWDKLQGFTAEIRSNLTMTEDEELLIYTRPLNFLIAKKPEEVLLETDIGGVFKILYRLVDRIALEKKDEQLAFLIFNQSYKDFFIESLIPNLPKKKIYEKFLSKEKVRDREYGDRYKQRLSDWFGISMKQPGVFYK